MGKILKFEVVADYIQRYRFTKNRQPLITEEINEYAQRCVEAGCLCKRDVQEYLIFEQGLGF